MSAGQGAEVPSLTARDLREPLRRLVGRDAEPTTWRVVPLRTPVRAATAAYRVEGAGAERDRAAPWSMVLKVVPASAEHARREVWAYQSGLLTFPHAGLATPRYLHVAEQADGTAYLWLTDVGADTYGAWPVPRYGVAARHLGLWSGAHPAEALPDHLWLARGWLRDWIGACAPALEELPRLLGAPAVRAAYPGDTAVRILRLWTERERLLDAVESLPQVLAHHDAHRANLIARDRSGASPRTFLVDWQFVGVAGVGLEAAPLLGSALTESLVAPEEATRLETTIYGGYVDGLRQAGWRGSDVAVRLGFAATAGLRYTLGATRFLLPALVDPAEGRRLETTLAKPLSAIAETVAELFPYFLRLADEAAELARGHAATR